MRPALVLGTNLVVGTATLGYVLHRFGAPAVELLARVGLSERLSHFPAQLSGGEQQRVAMARAFINQPAILFVDEPTGNLDAETSQKIIEILFEMNAAAKTTLVLVTHDLELAQRTRRIIRLKGGALVNGE